MPEKSSKARDEADTGTELLLDVLSGAVDMAEGVQRAVAPVCTTGARRGVYGLVRTGLAIGGSVVERVPRVGLDHGSVVPAGVRQLFVAVTLSRSEGSLWGRFVGDLMVTPASAADRTQTADLEWLGGLHHFDLLHHDIVYDAVLRWLHASGDDPGALDGAAASRLSTEPRRTAGPGVSVS